MMNFMAGFTIHGSITSGKVGLLSVVGRHVVVLINVS